MHSGPHPTPPAGRSAERRNPGISWQTSSRGGSRASSPRPPRTEVAGRRSAPRFGRRTREQPGEIIEEGRFSRSRIAQKHQRSDASKRIEDRLGPMSPARRILVRRHVATRQQGFDEEPVDGNLPAVAAASRFRKADNPKPVPDIAQIGSKPGVLDKLRHRQRDRRSIQQTQERRSIVVASRHGLTAGGSDAAAHAWRRPRPGSVPKASDPEYGGRRSHRQQRETGSQPQTAGGQGVGRSRPAP